jgi:hypothetical protein
MVRTSLCGYSAALCLLGHGELRASVFGALPDRAAEVPPLARMQPEHSEVRRARTKAAQLRDNRLLPTRAALQAQGLPPTRAAH